MEDMTKGPANEGSEDTVPMVTAVSCGTVEKEKGKFRIDGNREIFCLKDLIRDSMADPEVIRIQLEGKFKEFIKEKSNEIPKNSDVLKEVAKPRRGRPRKETNNDDIIL